LAVGHAMIAPETISEIHQTPLLPDPTSGHHSLYCIVYFSVEKLCDKFYNSLWNCLTTLSGGIDFPHNHWWSWLCKAVSWLDM